MFRLRFGVSLHQQDSVIVRLKSYIKHFNTAQCFKYGLCSQPRSTLPKFMPQSCLQAIAQKCNKNMSIYTLLFMMINRANTKIAFHILKRLLNITLQHILLPKLNSFFADLISTQKIYSIAINHLLIFFVIEREVEIYYSITLSRQFQIYTIPATASFRL